MKKIPRTIKSRSVYKNPFVEIKVDTLEINNKQWEQAYFIKPNKNGVGIFATDDTGIYLVQQYRYASHIFLWQIAMGQIDIDSTELETARNELLEETGLIAREFIKIGSFIAEPGMSNQKMFIYVAKGLSASKHVKKPIDVSEQGIEAKHFTFDEIKRMIATGEIKCGFTISAFYLFTNNYLKLP